MTEMEIAEMTEIQVPTHDSRVRNWLRVLGEPMTLFGEDSKARKSRLQAFLNSLDSDDVNELDFDSEVEGQEFFSVGVNDLRHVRRSILVYSMQMAKQRIQRQLKELDVPFATRKKIRHEFYSTLFNYETKSVQNGDERPLGFCKFSPNSKLLGVASWSGELRLWSVSDSSLVKSFKGHQDRLSAFDFHPQASLGQSESSVNLATAGMDGECRLWAMNSSESISKLTGHTARVARIGFHPSGKYIATTSFDQTWKLWDIASSKSVLTQPGHSRPLFALGFHPDGSLLATGGYDSVGRLWDLRTGKSIMLFRAHLKPILAMDFSNDGYRLATAGEDCSIKIWDIRASKSLYSIPGHTSSVTSVRFWKAGQDFGEPVQDGITTRDVLDSSFLVSSSYDGTVKLWTDGDFKPVRSLTSADGKIMSCDVSPSNQIIDIDGQYIATSLYDRNFKIMSNIKN